MSVSQSPEVVAERITRAYRADQDLYVEPAHAPALVIPQAVVAELGLPDSAFDAVAEFHDKAMRMALDQIIREARALAA